jgi:hypothetical protein
MITNKIYPSYPESPSVVSLLGSNGTFWDIKGAGGRSKIISHRFAKHANLRADPWPFKLDELPMSGGRGPASERRRACGDSENVSAMLDTIPNTRVPLAITGNRDPGPLASVLESRTTAVTAATVTTVTRTVTVTRRDRDVVTVTVTRGWERDRRTVESR